MKKIKVIQVMPEFELAGAQTMLENLVNNLDKDKFDVYIISLYNLKSSITERLENNNFKIFYLNKKRGLDLSIYKKLKKIFRDIQPDIIHTHGYVLEYVMPVKIFFRIKCKVVHTVHNIASKEVPIIQRFFQKIYFKHFNVVPVAISKKIQDTIYKQYKIKRENIPIIVNGIDLERCKEKTNYNKAETILNIGRLAEQKNQLLLIDVFYEVSKIYSDIKLNIIGEGPLRQQLIDKIKELKLEGKVNLLGSKAECYDDLNKSDIFILTSKWEGFPMTIIEAMGTGLPIVSTNVGGISDIVKDEKNGMLCIEDKEEIVEKLKKLIKDDKLRKRLGNQAKKTSVDFSAKEMARKYAEIYIK